MKKYMCFILLLSVVFTFSNCGNHGGVEATEPEKYLVLMHFTEPSYVNNIIVNDYKDGKYFVLMRGNRCDEDYCKNSFYAEDWVEEIRSLSGRTPYVELADGWYLVDWPWWLYPNNAQTLLTENTWDNYKGEYIFDKSTPHITGNIFKKKYIGVADLVVYSYPNGNYPTFTFSKTNEQTGEKIDVELNEYMYYSKLMGNRDVGSGLPYLNKGGECLCNRVEELDALWDLFRQQLNTLIENGDLNSLRPATEEQKRELLGR